MNAGEWCSGESWTRGARLKRNLVKLVTVVSNLSRKKRKRTYGYSAVL